MQHQHELEALNVKYGIFIPIMDDERDDDNCQYLVPAQLPKTSKERNNGDQLVAYLVFAHADTMQEWRSKKKGYVSAEEAKTEGFMPRCLFSAVAGQIVAHSQRVFNMSYEDMRCSNREISSSFQKHKFSVCELPNFNMLQILIQVETGLLIADTILNLVSKTVSSMMPGLKFAFLVPSDGGRLSEGAKQPTPHGYLVIIDGKGGLQQRLEANTPNDIPVGPGVRQTAIQSRRTFDCFLPPQGFRDWYDVFLSYRWGGLDTELNVALFSNVSTELLGGSLRRVHVFLDRHRLQDGQNFSVEFSTALINSTGAVLICSNASLERMIKLKENSDVDNLLLEWTIVLELILQKALHFVLPVLIGKVTPETRQDKGSYCTNLFADGIISELPPVVCTKVHSLCVVIWQYELHIL